MIPPQNDVSAHRESGRRRALPFLLLSILCLLILAAACNRFQPQPLSESARRELAARLRQAMAEAGGAQVWIKPPAWPQPERSPDASLQVVATPAAYRAVVSAVRKEARRHNLNLGASAGRAGNRLRAVNLRVSQHGQSILQIHLREAPRLLRAAIVIDDMGGDLEAARRLLALNYPLTFSVLPYLRWTREVAGEAHHRGLEVMLHLPMEPEAGAHASPGKGVVLVGMSAAEVRSVVRNDLADVPWVAGVNNHMGSRATQNAALMADVMQILADHHLYFIDSRTTPASVALEAARREHLPAFYRTVFLDDAETVPYTLEQLRKFRRTVEQEGVALAIGHPHPTTIAALAKFLPELERADIDLIAPSQIVRLPEIAHLHPRANSTIH